MKRHTVRQGENVHSIAQKYRSDANKIWSHGRNRHLRENRRNPNCLLPGDVLFIPENQDWFTGLSTGQTHYFEVKMPKKTVLKVTFRCNGQALSNCRYELKYDEESKSGTTDGSGNIEVPLPIEVTQAVVTFPERKRVFRLNLRHLNPVESESGVQARLSAMGYYFGGIDGVKGNKHKAALKRYKQKHGIEDADDSAVEEHIYAHYDQLKGD